MIVAACASVGGYAGQGAIEVEETVVEAESTISYEHATEKALRRAARQVAGVRLRSVSGTKDFELIRDTIYSRVNGYVRRHKVLNRKKGLQGTFRVRVHAEVMVGPIDDDIMAVRHLIEQQVRPRFQIDVKSIEGDFQGDPELWVETALMKELEETGFRVVDTEAYLENIKREQKIARLNGDERKAAFLGLQRGSVYEVKVRGTGRKWEDEAYGVPVTNYKLELSPRVVQSDIADVLSVDDAVAIVQDRGNLGTVGWRDACKSAVKQAYPTIRGGILGHWTRWLDIGRPITVQIYDASPEMIELLRRKIAAMETVEAVRTAETQPGGISNLRVIGRLLAADISPLIGEWTDGRLVGRALGPSKVGVQPPRRRTNSPTHQRETKNSTGSSGGEAGDSGSSSEISNGRNADAPSSNGEQPIHSSAPAPRGEGLPEYVLPAAIVGGSVVLGMIGAALILRR
jgi:hypothetical protein